MVVMTDAIFQIAYKRVRSRYTEDAWVALSPRQVTEAIYSEIREIDLQRYAESNPADMRCVDGPTQSPG